MTNLSTPPTLEGGVAICKQIVFEEFEVLRVEDSGYRIALTLGLPKKGGLREALERLYPKLTTQNCYPLVRRSERGLILHLFVKERSPTRFISNVGLAVVTLITVFLSGLALSQATDELGVTGFAWSPLAYLLGLLVPLLVHELGHWIVMRYYRTPSSLPYLIPAPPLQLGFLGTFGAVINLRWLPPSASSLTLMAIMGPLAGYLTAIPLAVYGLHNSIAVSEAPEGSITLPLVPLSLLLLTLTLDVPHGYMLLFSPLAFASYVVFFVTFLNLIPIAMLDGGHIVRGVGGARVHGLVSRALILLLIVLSIAYPQLLLFAIVALAIYFLSGGSHPGPSLGLEHSSRALSISSILYGVLLILTIPIPIG